MTIRQIHERLERDTLSPYAVLSENSLGRSHPIDECDIRTCFQQDIDRICHCKAFRRLKHKTQVFLRPEGDHYRTRLTHTLEVSRIARTISRSLRLNEDLTEAMAMAHDLGHTPFGHAGEYALDSIVPGGFRHNEQSVRVVEKLENGGCGLSLCKEVIDGILYHSGEGVAPTLEGRVLKYADRIAYINHDIDDAIRAGILSEEDIPLELRKELGFRYSDRIDCMVRSVIKNSSEETISMSTEIGQATDELRAFMFRNVYHNNEAKREEHKVSGMLGKLYDYYCSNPDKLPAESLRFIEEDGIERAVCDYIAGMTDQYAVSRFTEIFIPQGWERY